MDIVFDFDGVLCEYQGWRGHDNIGEPIMPMVDLVIDLHKKGHKLKLCTTRLNPHPFGDERIDEDVVSLKAKRTIIDWLDRHGILDCFVEITGYKPYGEYYIDDRALRYGDGRDGIHHTLDAPDIMALINYQEENKDDINV